MGQTTKDLFAPIPVTHDPTVGQGVTLGDTGYLPRADTRWHVVGNQGEPAFQNSWAQYALPFGQGRYRKLDNGMVTMGGLIQYGGGGSGNIVAFGLPLGYRPAPQADGTYQILIFSTAKSWTGAESIRIYGDTGNVEAEGLPAGGAWVSLAGVNFFAGL